MGWQFISVNSPMFSNTCGKTVSHSHDYAQERPAIDFYRAVPLVPPPDVVEGGTGSSNKSLRRELSLTMKMRESIDDVAYIFWAIRNMSSALLFRSALR